MGCGLICVNVWIYVKKLAGLREPQPPLRIQK